MHTGVIPQFPFLDKRPVPSMFQWLTTLPLHSYDVVGTHNPLRQAYAEMKKAQEAAVSVINTLLRAVIFRDHRKTDRIHGNCCFKRKIVETPLFLLKIFTS